VFVVRGGLRGLGEDLNAVWLYGSRARGDEPPHDHDVDLLVIATGGRQRHFRAVNDLMHDIALATGEDPFAFSTIVESPEWLLRRREIESFFVQEVDRDKIVLHGGS
jgi:predicted nucleotidyltransferase